MTDIYEHLLKWIVHQFQGDYPIHLLFSCNFKDLSCISHSRDGFIKPSEQLARRNIFLNCGLNQRVVKDSFYYINSSWTIWLNYLDD